MRISTRTAGSADQRGSVLVLAVMAAFFLFALCMGFVQLAQSTTRRLDQAVDSKRAFLLAEAGLAEAYAGLAIGKTGNVGTLPAPATIADGLFWVEAVELGDGAVRLESTALHGRGRVALALTARRIPVSVSELGFFVNGSVAVNPDVVIDSFDSSQGSYASQLAAGANLNQAVLGSNGDVTVSSGAVVNGEVLHGPTGSANLQPGATVTGTIGPRPAASALPPITVPTIPLGAAVSHGDTTTPLVIPPGDHGLDGLVLKSNTQAIFTGPSTLVFGSLKSMMNSEIIFDTRDGPIDVYINDDLDLGAGSFAGMLGGESSQVSIQVVSSASNAAKLGSNAQFYGHIYAPNTTASVSANFEIFGGIVASELNLAAQGKLHMDLNKNLGRGDVLPEMWAWHSIGVPTAIAAKGGDPFSLLGVDRADLPRPAAAHQDQQLVLIYEDLAGATWNYDGLESAFDWTKVSKVNQGTRDGVAFVSVPEPEGPVAEPEESTLTAEEQALIDILHSPLSSSEITSQLAAATPLTAPVLLEALQRIPALDGWGLYQPLYQSGPSISGYPGGEGSVPLAEEVLMACVIQTPLDSQALAWVLEQNSPLPSNVLDAAIHRIPAMKSSDLNKVLDSQ